MKIGRENLTPEGVAAEVVAAAHSYDADKPGYYKRRLGGVLEVTNYTTTSREPRRGVLKLTGTGDGMGTRHTAVLSQAPDDPTNVNVLFGRGKFAQVRDGSLVDADQDTPRDLRRIMRAARRYRRPRHLKPLR